MRKKQLIVLLLSILCCITMLACNNAKLKVEFVIDGEIVHSYESKKDLLVVKPEDPVKDGYTILTWYKDESCTEEWNFDEEKIVDNIKLYSKWVPVSELSAAEIINSGDFEVSEKVLSAKVSNSTETFNIAENIEVSTFASYKIYVDSECAEEANGEVALGMGENIYYIKVVSKDLSNTNIYTVKIYRKHLYSVVYKYNSDQSDTVLLVEEGKKISSIIPDAKEGYAFNSWGTWDFETDVITQNTVFNAIWTPNNYNIIYESTYDLAHNNPNSFTIETDTITLSEVNGRTGYTFIGWYTAENEGEQVVSIEKGSTGERTLYARWQVNNYQVSLDSGETIRVTFGEDYNLGIAQEKEGHTFIGWYTQTDIKLTDKNGIGAGVWSFGNNISAIAKYAKNIYRIDIIGYDKSKESINLYYGESLDLSSLIPSRSGYSFVGYYTDSINNEPIESIVMPANDIVLYQKWIAYDLNFDYDNKTAVSVNDTIDAKLFNAIVKDTDGKNIEVAASVIGEQIEGNTIAVRLIANGKYGVTKQITIDGIKVYGNPTLEHSKWINYYYVTESLDQIFWAYGKDTFGNDTRIEIFIEEQNYQPGDIVTVVFRAIDPSGNIAEAKNTEVKVYDLPKIFYDKDKTAISVNDDIRLELWNVSAVDTFGEKANVEYSYYTYSPPAGSTFEIYFRAYDVNWYYHIITLEIKVYGNPEINEPTKTDFGINDEITVEALGLTASDSFGYMVEDIKIELYSGEKAAGKQLVYLATATDITGNVSTKHITIKIYGRPELECSKTEISVIDDLTDPNTFGLSGKDSFNNPLNVSFTHMSGDVKGGQSAAYLCSVTDNAGNTTEKYFSFSVYSADDIKINYYPGSTNSIKAGSRGEEFYASASDSFKKPCDISIVAVNGVLEGGNIVDIVIRATDKLGNYKDSDIIHNIKVYGAPTITNTIPNLYLRPHDDISLLFMAKDSFGKEFGARFITVDETESLLTVRVEATDVAGNIASEIYEINKLQSDQSVLFMYIGNQYVGAEIATVGSDYSLNWEPGYSYIWRYNREQITDSEGKSLSAWAKQGLWYKVFAEVKIITYKLTYTLNGGVNNAGNPSSYTVTSLGGTEGTIDLLVPTKSDKKELLSYEYLVTNEFNNTVLTTIYTFGGWYKEATFNTPVTAISFYLGNTTFYARWIDNTITETVAMPYARINADNTPNYYGKYILFGEFQQSMVKDDVTILGESDRAGYYLGSDGFYYAKGKNDYYSRENYFKVEPIKWRILQESNGTALLHCDNALENIKFDTTSNIYEESDIRLWLNNDFYNKAFNFSQKEKVQATQLENNITDNVFILSHSELQNSQYGFVNNHYADTARERKASDYAEFVGGLTEDSGKCVYWSRTAAYEYVRYCTTDGNITPVEKPYSHWLCVVPALKIQLS